MKKYWPTIRDYFLIILAALIQALSLRLFFIPANLASGGVSGIAQLINHFTGWPIGLMILLGNVAITLIIFPFLMVLVALFSLGLGLFLSVFNVRYRDVNYLVGIGMQLLFYATPLIYPLTLVPEEVKGIPLRQIIEMQPMTQFVEWSRDAFYTLEWPSLASVAGTTLASVVTFVVGWWVFSVKTRNIAEEL